MKVKLAKTAGFCAGVKSAVELILRVAGENKGPIFTWGPLIHNPQTVAFLQEQGINVAEKIEDISPESTVVIRSHGVPPETRRALSQAAGKLCDATCKKVAKVQSTVKRFAEAGRSVVIVGDSQHAESRALLGFAGDNGFIVSSVADVERLQKLVSPVVIAQTTLIRESYLQVANAIKNRFPDAEIMDTLCESTSLRQSEVVELAKEADGVVVVGGFNSSNTAKLFEIARTTGVPAFWVETADELEPDDFMGMTTVVVTAGASTPHWIVARVIERLEGFGKKDRKIWEYPRVKNLGYALIQGNIVTGMAAAMLAATFAFMLGESLPWRLFLAYGIFIFAMHTIYNIVDWQGFALDDPSKVRFFWANKKILSYASAFALAFSLLLTLGFGLPTFSSMLLGVIFATSFAFVRRIPNKIRIGRFSSWRELPGAKDTLHTAGWFYAAGIMPALALSVGIIETILPILWVAILSLLRSLLFSITDLETDRVLGRESLATIIGEKRGWFVSLVLAGLSAIILLLRWILYRTSPTTLVLLFLPIYMLVLISRLRKTRVSRGTWAELAIDGGFVLCGGLALAFSIV